MPHGGLQERMTAPDRFASAVAEEFSPIGMFERLGQQIPDLDTLRRLIAQLLGQQQSPAQQQKPFTNQRVLGDFIANNPGAFGPGNPNQ